MSRKEKGATNLDKLCHTLYDVPKGAGFLAEASWRPVSARDVVDH